MSHPSRRVRATNEPLTEALGVGYARYSTDDQSSTTEQVAINVEVAAEDGVRIVETFKDEAVSRSIHDRPGLREMFAYLADHPEIRYIVVNELERLTAGIEQRAEVARLCMRSGISILTEDMGKIDPRDEEAMHKADRRSVDSEGELIRIRRRTKRNLRAKVRNGTVAMRPCYGIRMKPLVGPDGVALPSGARLVDERGRKITSGEIELHPDEHPWLLKIFDWADEGKPSDWIAAELTRRGVPTKSGRAEWRGNTVNGILDNPFYKGIQVWGQQAVVRKERGVKSLEVRDEDDPNRLVLESPLGAIIPVEQWDRINARRVAKRNERSRTRRVYPGEPFDAFVYCGRCGHRMYGRNEMGSRGYSWRYFCVSKRTGNDIPKGEAWKRCEYAHSISLKTIVKLLSGARVKGVRLGSAVKIQEERKTVADADSQRRRLLKAIEQAESEYKNAKRLAIKGAIDDDDLAEAAEESARTIGAAQERIAALDASGEVSQVPWDDEQRETWKRLMLAVADESRPLAWRVEMLRTFGLERLYVDGKSLRINVVH